MKDTIPIITLNVPIGNMALILNRITTFLLQHEYAFLQTFQQAQPMGINIFPPPPQLGLHLNLHLVDSDVPPVITTSTGNDNLPSETASLLQRLLEVCDPSGDLQQPSPPPNNLKGTP